MKTAILKLRPNSQFHFGKVGLDENMSLNATSEYIHSDTLFSAMINIISSVVEDNTIVNEFINEIENGKIAFSSAFYLLSVFDNKKNKKNDIIFLPKPINASVSEKENYKDIKKIKFVSKQIIEQEISAEQWNDESKCIIIDKKFVCKKEEIDFFNEHKQLKIYSVVTEPKVRVRTKEKKDTLYNQANLMIADNKFISAEQDYKFEINFYFLYDISEANEKNKKLFNLFLDLLPEVGVGGQRSTGAGFVKEIITKDCPNFTKKNKDNSEKKYLNLSLFIPKSEKEFKDLKCYNFITRGGRNTGTNDLQQKRVRMITEGSISKSKLKGKIAEITPEGSKNIYKRNGKGFFIEI